MIIRSRGLINWIALVASSDVPARSRATDWHVNNGYLRRFLSRRDSRARLLIRCPTVSSLLSPPSLSLSSLSPFDARLRARSPARHKPEFDPNSRFTTANFGNSPYFAPARDRQIAVGRGGRLRVVNSAENCDADSRGSRVIHLPPSPLHSPPRS